MKPISKIAFIALALMTNLSAQEVRKRPKFKPPTFALGAVMIHSQSPYLGRESRTRVVPGIFYKGDTFFVRNTSIGVELLKEDRFQLEMLAKYRFVAYEASDSPGLAGMEDREGTIEAGLRAQYKFDLATVELAGYSDILGRHGGQEVDLKVRKDWRWRFLAVSPYVGVSYLTSSYSNYYYGVSAAETSSTRAQYSPGQAMNWNTGVSVRAGLNQHVLLFANVGYEFLDSNISDSPIVNRDGLFKAIIGLSYGF